MPRSHSIRSVVRSLLNRPKASPGYPARTTLGVMPLEDRVVPAFVDVSGLRFDIPGNFNSSAVAGGTKYDGGPAAVSVGLTPVGAAAFQPLFTLDGGGSVTDTGTDASPFTWNTGVSAVTSGTPLPLFAGKADTQTVAQTLPGSAAAAIHTSADKSVPLGPFALTPSGFRVSSVDKLGLAGSFGITDFGGIKLADVGLGKFVTAPADAGASFSTTTIEGGFQLGANTAFNVGGLSFKAGSNPSLPNVGGYVRITTATGQVEVAGQAKVTIAGNPVDISSGQYDVADASKFVPGAVFLGGVAQKLDLKVTADLKLGGLNFTAKDLNGTYDRPAATFTLKGTAGFALKGSTVSVNFGDATTAGLTIANGTVTNAAFAVDSTLKLGGLMFTAKALAATFDNPTNTYTLKGTARFDLKGNAVSVNFGDAATAGLVVTDGTVTNADFTVTSLVKVGGLEFKAINLAASYTDGTSTYAIRGGSSFDLKGNTVGVTFGGKTTAGLVVTGGTVTSADFTVDAKIAVGGSTFTANDLRATYTNANSTYTLKGTAAFALKDSTVAVTFGDKATAGLVIANGTVSHADFSVDATLALGGLTFTANNLRATYTDATSTYTLKGTATFTLEGSTVAVTLGDSKGVGLVVVNGAVQSFDFTLDSKIVVGSLAITSKDLRATYTDADSKYTLAGTATATITGLGTLNLTLGSAGKPGLVITGGSLASLDATLDSDVTVSGVKITTTGLNLTYAAKDSTFNLAGAAQATITGVGTLGVTFGFAGKPGLVIQNASLVSLDVTLTSDITVSKVTFKTTGLRLTYTAATTQFTLAGAAMATVTGLGDFGVTFGFQGKPGLVIQDGSLAFLDLTLNANLTVSGVTITTTGLELTYTAATNQFTLAGSAQATIQKLGTVGVTFGFQGKPGLVVQNGSLVSLDVTLNSDITVSSVRIVTTGLELSYRVADDKFTLTGSTVVSTPQLGSVNVTFGYDNKPGLVVQNGALVSLDLRVNSNFTFLKYTFTVENLDLSYSADTSKFTVRGKASVDLLLGTFAIVLGDGNGGQGLVITNGKVTSIDATISGKVGVAFVSLGQVTLNLKYDGGTGVFEITGKADITLAISLPTPVNLFLKGPSFHVGVVEVQVRVVPGDNPNSFTKFSARTGGGNSYMLKITFSGEVTSDGLTAALASGLTNAVGNAGIAAGNTVANAARSVFRFGRRLFGGRDNELSGATVFYDLNANRILDPGEQFAVLGADGTASRLATTAGVGQLVVFGGTNVGTNLPNKLVLTAPADATKASPMSTLVQAIRAAQAQDDQPDLSVVDAMVYVEVALGVPGDIDPLNDDVIQAAVGGSTSASKAFAADVEVATLAKGVSALVGESAADGAAAFAALASLIASTGGPIDLSDPAAVGQLIRDTAVRLKITLDPAVVDGGATVIAGIIARIKAIPAPDGTAFVRELAKIQKAANNDAFPMLAAAAAGKIDIAAVVAAQTGAAFAAEVADETVGVLTAATSNASPLYAIGAGPGGGPLVRVYDRQTNAVVATFFAFDPKFTGGVSVAVGDVTGDGVPDVVVAAGDGGHARVIVIDGTKLNAVGADGQINSSAMVASFFAFEVGFTGGGSLALARLDSSPGLNIVVGAGAGGGPRVRTFNWTPEAPGGVSQLAGTIGDFFAFDPAARVGVNVAAGDLDGLGRDDLIIGAGVGGGPVVAIYLPDGTLRDMFFAGEATLRGGVSVAAGFLDGNATAQLVTASGPGSPTFVNVYRGDDLALERTAPAFGSDFTDGASVSVGPDEDGDVRVVVGAGPGGGPRIRVLAAEGLRSVEDFFAFEPTFLGGVNVG